MTLVPLEPEQLIHGLPWPPSVASFESRPLLPGAGVDWLTNDIVQAILGAAIAIAFWLIVSHHQKVVPGKRQFVGEFLYNLIRNTIAREMIGADYRKFLPYLVALFTFILVNNWFGETFVFMFPTFSKVGYAYGLALLSWLLYNGIGIAKYGPLKYLKKTCLPEGVPVAFWIILIPLEFISNIIVRPITLALRLFGNMFAGHLIMMVFVVGGTILLQSGVLLALAGGVSVVLSFLLMGLELFIGALQAYIFTVLTAQYVGSALAEEH